MKGGQGSRSGRDGRGNQRRGDWRGEGARRGRGRRDGGEATLCTMFTLQTIHRFFRSKPYIKGMSVETYQFGKRKGEFCEGRGLFHAGCVTLPVWSKSTRSA